MWGNSMMHTSYLLGLLACVLTLALPLEAQKLDHEAHKSNPATKIEFPDSVLGKPDLSPARCKFVCDSIEKENKAMDNETKFDKYGAMLSNKNIFMTLSPSVYYHDIFYTSGAELASQIALTDWKFKSSETAIFLHGNIGTSCFMSYLNSEDKVAYGLRNFEDALIGDYQLDLWRMAQDLIMLAEDDESPAGAEAIVNDFSSAYVQGLKQFIGNDNEINVEFTAANTDGELKTFLEAVDKRYSQAKLLNEFAENGKLAAGQVSLISVNDSIRTQIGQKWSEYGKTLDSTLKFDKDYFLIKDIGRVGDNDSTALIVMIDGPTKAHDDDILLSALPVDPTAWAGALPNPYNSMNQKLFKSGGSRIASTALAFSRTMDPFIGYFTAGDGVQYSVSQKNPYEATIDDEDLRKQGALKKLAAQWGLMLATFHARADNDYHKNEIDYSFEEQAIKIIDTDVKAFQSSILKTALLLTRQSHADYSCFSKWTRRTYPAVLERRDELMEEEKQASDEDKDGDDDDDDDDDDEKDKPEQHEGKTDDGDDDDDDDDDEKDHKEDQHGDEKKIVDHAEKPGGQELPKDPKGPQEGSFEAFNEPEYGEQPQQPAEDTTIEENTEEDDKDLQQEPGLDEDTNNGLATEDTQRVADAHMLHPALGDEDEVDAGETPAQEAAEKEAAVADTQAPADENPGGIADAAAGVAEAAAAAVDAEAVPATPQEGLTLESA